MVSRYADLERKTLIVQFVAVEPLAFYTTSDGTDLVQDTLRSQLARPDAEIFGQEGSVSMDDQGEFLVFEPTDTQNRTLHLPIEHLAYCGALRRMNYDPSDRRDPDRIQRREFENVDLANRYAQYIVGPPIFVAVFHGFDNALCYTFITQSADDACLLVMKLMRAFKLHEQQQGQRNQGSPSFPPIPNIISGTTSPVDYRRGSPNVQASQPYSFDNRQIQSSPSFYAQTSNPYNQNPQQDELIQRLLANPNLQLVRSGVDDLPILSAPSSSSMNQGISSINMNNSLNPSNSMPLIGRSSPQLNRPPSPPIFGVSDTNDPQNLIQNNPNARVVYKPNNQEVVYKQNIMVRWLQPPTPPPPAPIIIREVQAPAPSQPPLICRQIPPCPPTPPPIIVREKPPPCPPTGQPIIIEKRVPPVCLPRQVIIERYPAPLAKPSTIVYEKYLPQPQQPRQIIVRREICRSAGYPTATQQTIPERQIVRQVVRQIPAAGGVPRPAVIGTSSQQQSVNQQAVQQLVPVYAQRQHVIQPKGVRVIRQVLGPTQIPVQQQQQQQIFASTNPPIIQTVPATIIQ